MGTLTNDLGYIQRKYDNILQIPTYFAYILRSFTCAEGRASNPPSQPRYLRRHRLMPPPRCRRRHSLLLTPNTVVDSGHLITVVTSPVSADSRPARAPCAFALSLSPVLPLRIPPRPPQRPRGHRPLRRPAVQHRFGVLPLRRTQAAYGPIPRGALRPGGHPLRAGGPRSASRCEAGGADCDCVQHLHERHNGREVRGAAVFSTPLPLAPGTKAAAIEQRWCCLLRPRTFAFPHRLINLSPSPLHLLPLSSTQR